MNEKPEGPAPSEVLKIPVHLVASNWLAAVTLCGISCHGSRGEADAPPYVMLDNKPPFISEGGAFICEGDPPDPDYQPPSWTYLSKGPTDDLTVGINADDVCPECLRISTLKSLADL